ncbi:cytochrome family subfamily polypeptide 55 precursor [Stylonychia lemnae]|uniref:Cytochrome family subfamily polypeptide 55 n=1 Tax=Stylonychia lemnae TaxID=5949 RepID=A0A078ACX5_STYLE|nr:cytochrome family subfamily polypeptide 55 precursor [Stylonychia lemnae]|eukprot:CDW80105.1 cytochrome family subfamily polypeptide 55 precursor [Stylonychia lemnae]
MLIQTFMLLVFGYIFWEKIIKLYYNYWYYTSQGIVPTDFPLPIIGGLHNFAQLIKRLDKYNEHPSIEYIKWRVGENLPPMVYDLKIPTGAIVINDPDVVQELFSTSKAKYLDKYSQNAGLFEALTGKDGLPGMKTQDPNLSIRRKHVSAAFYKDRLTIQLEAVIKLTFNRLKDMKEALNESNNEINLTSWLGEMVMHSIQICVFGLDSNDLKLDYIEQGKIQTLPLSMFMKKLSVQLFVRIIKVYRLCFSSLNSFYIGQQEQEYRQNALFFRQFLKDVISQRRKRISEGYQSNDFVDLLIRDELYEGKDETILDECCIFMLGATQTTVTTINNALIYIYKDNQILQKLREEIAQNFNFKDISLLTSEHWIKQFNYDKMSSESTYIQKIVSETLRIEPPFRLSARYELTETLELKGYRIKKGDPLLFNIYGLSRDPKTWIEPEKFIPERFDPDSKYFLTPDGKKRKSSSYIPFFGGLRVCVGKTFADSFVKTIIPIIVNLIDFEFIDKSIFEKKIPISIGVEPEIKVKASFRKDF